MWRHCFHSVGNILLWFESFLLPLAAKGQAVLFYFIFIRMPHIVSVEIMLSMLSWHNTSNIQFPLVVLLQSWQAGGIKCTRSNCTYILLPRVFIWFVSSRCWLGENQIRLPFARFVRSVAQSPRQCYASFAWMSLHVSVASIAAIVLTMPSLLATAVTKP